MNKRLTLKSLLSATALAVAALAGTPAWAQTKLKWAHVYETSEPYHTRSVWAADEIKKRTNGRYEIAGVPGLAAGQGNRHQPGPDAGHGGHHLHRRSVCRAQLPAAGDRRLRRSSSATPTTGSSTRKSDVFKELAEGYDEQDRQQDHWR